MQDNTGLRRLILAAGNSVRGLRYAWKYETAFRQELYVYAIMIPAGFYLGGNAVEKALLVGSCLILLITEIINSSIEAVVDRIGREYHKLSGAAKDLSSAAVLLGWVFIFLVWGLILYEHYGA